MPTQLQLESRELAPLLDRVRIELGPQARILSAEKVRTGGIGGFVPLSPETLDQHVQAPFYAALSFLLIGAALAGLFVAPRRWSHVLGLISLPVLYLGGIAFGAAVMITYDVDDPGLTGRYALSIAPLVMLVLADSLAGKGSQRAIAGFAMAFFLTMLGVFVT